MTDVTKIQVDPWLNELKEKNLILYKEFIKGAANFLGMSKALFIYCNEDLESDNLIDIFNNNSDDGIIKKVLTHEKCPKELIKDIINGKLNKKFINLSRMLEFVAERSDLSLNEIKTLLHRNTENLKKILAENINLNDELIEKLSKDSDRSVRSKIAKREDIKPKIIEKLINDNDYFVRSNIARYQNLKDSQILKLIKDKESSVRQDLVLNEKIPTNSLIILANDQNMYVLLELCKKKDSNEEILKNIVSNLKFIINKLDIESETRESDFKMSLEILRKIIQNSNITSTNLETISRFLLEKQIFQTNFSWLDLQYLKNDLLNEILMHQKLPDNLKVEFLLLGLKPENNNSYDLKDRMVLDAEFEEDYSKLSSQIFRFGIEPDQKEEIKAYVSKFTQIFTDLGHPLGLLNPLTNFHPEIKYDIGQTFSEWVSHEIIYRTLWPEISKRKDVKFWIHKSHYYGEQTNYQVEGINSTFMYDSNEKYSCGLNFPFIDEWGEYRDWITDSEEIDLADAIDAINFNYLDVQDFEDDVISDEIFDYFLAYAIKSVSKEVEITTLGKDFIIGAVWESGILDESYYTSAEIDFENCHVYGWSKIKLEKQEFIINLIIKGLQSNNQTIQIFSKYFLITIALIPDLNLKIKNILEELKNDSISKALNLSSK